MTPDEIKAVVKPPGTILTSDYINGKIGTVDQVKYYYFPIDYEKMGSAMIILNKTQIFGTGDNGDTKLIANIINETEN